MDQRPRKRSAARAGACLGAALVAVPASQVVIGFSFLSSRDAGDAAPGMLWGAVIGVLTVSPFVLGGAGVGFALGALVDVLRRARSRRAG